MPRYPSATCSARSAVRLPITTSWPAAAKRRVRPRPWGPVPPRIPIFTRPPARLGRSGGQGFVGSDRAARSSGDSSAAVGDKSVSGCREAGAMTENAAVSIRFDVVALDTADPPRLAEFYTALLGWQVEQADEDWITIGGGSGPRLAFQLPPDHAPPPRPPARLPAPPRPRAAHLARPRGAAADPSRPRGRRPAGRLPVRGVAGRPP